jgi:hypothetical protein
VPPLPFAQAPKLTVQLHDVTTPYCWGAQYSAPAGRNGTDQFKDKGD